MKSKRHLLAALTAAAVLSAGSMTAFAAEAPVANTCPYVCSNTEYCQNGLHGEDCPVYGCENHSEHCGTAAAGGCAVSRRHHRASLTGSHHRSAYGTVGNSGGTGASGSSVPSAANPDAAAQGNATAQSSTAAPGSTAAAPNSANSSAAYAGGSHHGGGHHGGGHH